MITIVWDMGGTMFDTYPEMNAAFADALDKHGHGVSLDEIGELTSVSTDHAIETLSTRYGVDASILEKANDDLKEYWKTHPAPPRPGLENLMLACKLGGGKNLVVTHRDAESARTLLSGHGIEVDDMICAPSGYPRKPDPTMLRTILERNGVAPVNAISIGDRSIDCEAARAAGVDAYSVTDREAPHYIASFADFARSWPPKQVVGSEIY